VAGETGRPIARAATVVNARHLAPAFLDAVVGRYAGSRLGRQELDGEIVEERADTLWTRGGLDLPPPRRRRSHASWSRSIHRPQPA